MLRRYFLEIAFIVIESLLAFLGLLENLSAKLAWWQRLFDAPEKATSAVMLMMVAVLALYVGLKMALEANRGAESRSNLADVSNDLSATAHSIQSTVDEYFRPETAVKVLREQEFYEQFPNALRRASTLIYLAHLDVRAPSDYYLEGSPGHVYYQQIFEIIKSKQAVQVRRIERLSKEKIDWIEEHINKLKGCRNFSLSCFVENQRVPLPKALSVQCIDDTDVVLVAVAKHTSPTEPRDIWITGERVAKMWRDYYEQRLLAGATPVIVNGNVQEVAWNQLKSSLS